jgi:hypothetical protein
MTPHLVLSRLELVALLRLAGSEEAVGTARVATGATRAAAGATDVAAGATDAAVFAALVAGLHARGLVADAGAGPRPVPGVATLLAALGAPELAVRADVDEPASDKSRSLLAVARDNTLAALVDDGTGRMTLSTRSGEDPAGLVADWLDVDGVAAAPGTDLTVEAPGGLEPLLATCDGRRVVTVHAVGRPPGSLRVVGDLVRWVEDGNRRAYVVRQDSVDHSVDPSAGALLHPTAGPALRSLVAAAVAACVAVAGS